MVTQMLSCVLMLTSVSLFKMVKPDKIKFSTNWEARAKGSSLNCLINQELLVIRQDLTRKRNKNLILAGGGYRDVHTEITNRKLTLKHKATYLIKT